MLWILLIAGFFTGPVAPWLSPADTSFRHNGLNSQSTESGTASPTPIKVLGDGTLSVQESAEIPPYGDSGRWQESTSRSSSRFVTRHFLFVIPGQPPAMEVYVTADRANEIPDGVFETNLIRGYLKSFSSGIGFTFDSPDFIDVSIDSTHAQRCRVELTKGDRKIWVYAYVFLRRPSLIFLTVRPQADASREIEEYLARVRLK